MRSRDPPGHGLCDWGSWRVAGPGPDLPGGAVRRGKAQAHARGGPLSMLRGPAAELEGPAPHFPRLCLRAPACVHLRACTCSRSLPVSSTHLPGSEPLQVPFPLLRTLSSSTRLISRPSSGPSVHITSSGKPCLTPSDLFSSPVKHSAALRVSTTLPAIMMLCLMSFYLAAYNATGTGSSSFSPPPPPQCRAERLACRHGSTTLETEH